VLFNAPHVKTISMDCKGVGRYAVTPSTTVLFYNDIKVAELLRSSNEAS